MPGATAQEIDPLSGITARVFVVAVGCVALLVAGVLTVLNRHGVLSLPLLLLSFALLVAGFGFLVWSADPYRRRVTRARYGISYGLVLLAAVLESVAQLGRDTDLRNDWGPISVALVLMVSGSYRRPPEIVLRTVIAAVVVAAATILHTGTTDLSELIGAATMSGTLVVALGGGAAIFAFSLTAGLRADRLRADEARRTRDLRDRRRAIEEFLGNDIESLRRDVLPFFRELKARDVLTDDDRVRAAALAKSLRTSLALSLAGEPLERLVGTFADPRGVARALSAEQRTALRTVLYHLAGQPGLAEGGLSLTLGREARGGEQPGERMPGERMAGERLAGERLTGELSASFGADTGVAAGIAPFVGLMQLSFLHVDADTANTAIAIHFEF